MFVVTGSVRRCTVLRERQPGRVSPSGTALWCVHGGSHQSWKARRRRQARAQAETLRSEQKAPVAARRRPRGRDEERFHGGVEVFGPSANPGRWSGGRSFR